MTLTPILLLEGVFFIDHLSRLKRNRTVDRVRKNRAAAAADAM